MVLAVREVEALGGVVGNGRGRWRAAAAAGSARPFQGPRRRVQRPGGCDAGWPRIQHGVRRIRWPRGHSARVAAGRQPAAELAMAHSGGGS